MSRSFVTHNETIGRRIHWLVDVEIGGYVYRASDEDVEVDDANGNSYTYTAGLGNLSVRVTTEGVDGVSVTLSADVQGSAEGWPSVLPNAPTGCPATVRRWVEGQTIDEARIIVSGEIVSATYDGADDPIDLQIKWRENTPSPVPPVQAQISAATWPLTASYAPDNAVLGACYPLVFGQPGYRDDMPWGATVVAAYSTPAYLAQHSGGVVSYSGCRIVLGWIPPGLAYHASTVHVFREHDDTTSSTGRGYAVQSMAVLTDTDLLGHTLATVAPGAWVSANSTIRFIPGRQFWVRWNGGGGVINTERTGPMRKAGEIITTLLRTAGLDVDDGRMQSARGRLDAYLLDFALVESVDDVREVIESRMGVPLARRQSADGMWYEPINYAPRPEDAVMHLVRVDHDDEAAGWVEIEETTSAPMVRVEKAGPVNYTDDDVSNTVTVRYAYDRAKVHTQEVVVTGGVPVAARNEIGSVVCASSRARYGERVGPVIELRMVHDRATAETIAIDTAARLAYQRRLTSYRGDVADLEVLEVGDIVRVTDRERAIDSELAIVMAADYTLTTVTVDVEVLDYLAMIGPQDEASYAVDYPGAEIILTAYDVTATAGTISSLRDISGAGSHATAVTGTAPTWSSSYAPFGGRPAIVCSGGSIATTASFGTDTDCTFVCAFYDASATGAYESPGGIGTYTANISFFRDNTDANEWTLGVVEAGAPYGQVVTAADGAPHVLVFRRVGSTHTVWVDGTLAATKTGNTTTTTPGTASVGATPSSGNFGGAVGFLGYWPRGLSDDDVRSLSSRIWRGALGQSGVLP